MEGFWTPRRIYIGTLLCMGKFLLLVCTLGIASFYPNEALSRGSRPFEIGCVFASFPLVGFFLSPFAGNMINRGWVSPKKTLLCGLVIEAIFMTAFSLLGFAEDIRAFSWCSVAFRLLQGVGVTLSSVSYHALGAVHLGERKASFLPIMEMFAGFGVMLGPTIGGFLYELAGFSAPYGTFCALICLFSFLLLAVLPLEDIKANSQVSVPNPTDSKNELVKPPAFSMLWNPVVAADLLGVLVAFVSIAFNDSTFAVTLEPFGLNGTARGMAFFVSAAAFSIGTLSADKVAKKLKPADPRLLSVFGGVVIATSWYLYSPKLRGQPQSVGQSLVSVMVGQALLGLGAGVFYVISYNGSFEIMTNQLGYPDDFTSYSVLSGCLHSAFFLGSLIGSAGGGALVQHCGFLVCIRIIGITTLAYAFLYTGVIFTAKFVRSQRKPQRPENPPATEPFNELSSHL